jgi:hypothetical protein
MKIYFGIAIVIIGLFGIFFISKPEIMGRSVGDSFYELNESDLNENNILSQGPLTIKKVEYKDKKLEIDYIFNNSKFIGENISVEIWILNSYGEKIKDYIDTFSIRRDSPIERKIDLTISKDPGVKEIYIALLDKRDDYVKQNIIIGNSKTTGNTILESPKNKFISYVIFLIIIGIGIFLIIKSHTSKIHYTMENLKVVNKNF